MRTCSISLQMPVIQHGHRIDDLYPAALPSDQPFQAGARRNRTDLSLHPVRTSSERCWFLGMIVFELVSNAARHAFPR